MNSQYYDKTRKYLVRHFAILHMSRCDDSDVNDAYLDTAQDTIILILQKLGAGVVAENTTPSGGGGGGGGITRFETPEMRYRFHSSIEEEH